MLRGVLRATAGTAGVGATLALFKSETLLVAYHEAGHCILAQHLEASGVRCSGGWHGKLSPPSPPLLRFATVVPRVTDRGVQYMGETKLTVRWRHMHLHSHWWCGEEVGECALEGGDVAQTPSLMIGEQLLQQVAAAELPANSGGIVGALLLLSRLSFCMGGRVAEDILWSRVLPALPIAAAAASASGTERSVQRLIDAPGRASGDLRQSKRLTQGVPTVALLEVCYSYTRDVLEQRWSQV